MHFEKAIAPTEVYDQNAADCQKLIAEIQSRLKEHKRIQTRKPSNWGYAGDLDHVKHQLQEIVEFLR